MNRVVHFEIHAKDLDRTQKFYEDVFGWAITDMGPQMGNFRVVVTGKDEPGSQWNGINGGIIPRHGEGPKGGEPVNAFICTIKWKTSMRHWRKYQRPEERLLWLKWMFRVSGF